MEPEIDMKKRQFGFMKGIPIAVAGGIALIVALGVIGSLLLGNGERAGQTPLSDQRHDTGGTEGSQQTEEAASMASYDLELIAWSWSDAPGREFVEVSGWVKNISGRKLSDVEVVASFFGKKGDFIACKSALIEFNPILPDQTSPFRMLATNNPAMETAKLEFKFLTGGTIRCYRPK